MKKGAQITTDFTDLHGICAQMRTKGPKMNADGRVIDGCWDFGYSQLFKIDDIRCWGYYMREVRMLRCDRVRDGKKEERKTKGN